MTVYRVTLQVNSLGHADVEADSPEEAAEKAEQLPLESIITYEPELRAVSVETDDRPELTPATWLRCRHDL